MYRLEASSVQWKSASNRQSHRRYGREAEKDPYDGASRDWYLVFDSAVGTLYNHLPSLLQALQQGGIEFTTEL